MSYATPVVDPRYLVTISSAALYFWPLVLVTIVAAVRWRSLTRRFAFVVLGYLVCAGIEGIVGRVGHTFAWIQYIGAVPRDQIVVALVNTSLSVAAISLVVSPIPVLWLASVCAGTCGGSHLTFVGADRER